MEDMEKKVRSLTEKVQEVRRELKKEGMKNELSEIRKERKRYEEIIE